MLVQNQFILGIIWMAKLKKFITTVLPSITNGFQDIKTINCKNIELSNKGLTVSECFKPSIILIDYFCLARILYRFSFDILYHEYL